MTENIAFIYSEMKKEGLYFDKKPILIGGRAMEYYEIRKAGADIDLVICNEDYKALEERYPDKKKDLYGDLGFIIGKFEIWRSIALLDYNFFDKDAIEEEPCKVVSLDRLLWTRVCAMDVEKYRNDLKLMREFYYKKYTNPEYYSNYLKHESSYKKHNGAIIGGKYDD